MMIIIIIITICMRNTKKNIHMKNYFNRIPPYLFGGKRRREGQGKGEVKGERKANRFNKQILPLLVLVFFFCKKKSFSNGFRDDDDDNIYFQNRKRKGCV